MLPLWWYYGCWIRWLRWGKIGYKVTSWTVSWIVTSWSDTSWIVTSWTTNYLYCSPLSSWTDRSWTVSSWTDTTWTNVTRAPGGRVDDVWLGEGWSKEAWRYAILSCLSIANCELFRVIAYLLARFIPPIFDYFRTGDPSDKWIAPKSTWLMNTVLNL